MSDGTLSVLVGGRELTALEPISVETYCAVNRIGTARIVYVANAADAHHVWKAIEPDVQTCAPGTVVQVKFKPQQGTEIVVFDGIVTAPLNPAPDQAFVLEAAHALQKLASSYRSQVFIGKSDKDILNKLLKEQGLTLDAVDGLAEQHEQIVQWSCSDWAWLRSRVAANPVWLIAAGKDVSCKQPTLQSAKLTLLAVPTEDDVQILTQEWVRDCRALPKSLSVAYWDVKQQKMEQVKANTPKIGEKAFAPAKALNSETWQVTYRIPLTKSEAQALADARLLALFLAAVQARVTVVGGDKTVGLRPGDTLELKGFEAFDGRGLMTEVLHRWRGGVWRTTVSIGQPVPNVASVQAGLMPGVLGHASAVVDKFKADPVGLNRIQVKVPGLIDDSGKALPIWARPGFAYASNGSGLCFYPEQGDEVVLAFMEDDPRFPVIVSAVHNPKNKAPFEPSEENAKKGLVLAKSKQQFVFDVKENSVELSVDEATLEIKKEAGTTLRSKHTLTFEGDKALLKAGNGITIGDGQRKQFEISAQGITVKAGAELELKEMGAQLKGSKVELNAG